MEHIVCHTCKSPMFWDRTGPAQQKIDKKYSEALKTNPDAIHYLMYRCTKQDCHSFTIMKNKKDLK